MRMTDEEKQHCDDCISREAVIEWLKDKDVIKMKYQEENARRGLASLPSVTPQRPKGKWTQKTGSRALCCSVCEDCIPEEIPYAFDYCPNCGADMRGEEENE